MTRQHLLIALLLASLPCFAADQPNFVIILTDNQGYGDLLAQIEAFQADLAEHSRPAAFVENPKPFAIE